VQIEQQGEAYRLATVARAQGDAARFLSVFHAFKAAQDVTTERLYLETMEEVLKNSNKVILDKSAQGGNGVLPFLPLPTLGMGGKAVALPPGNPPGTAQGGGGAQVQSSDNAASTPQPSGTQQ
jgi:modulator of FtsH protease HflK